MSETLIKAENISKKFCLDLKTSLWYGLKDIGSEMIGKKNQFHDVLREKEFWAVKDISFEVKRGECLGLIGRNGAGKSTLLKILNGIIKPDEGRIEMHGRVGALIELGAGFNPILTGRENIFNNAAVLGFTKEETQQKLQSIIDFSEITDFIDTPVQNYSSGMKVRLGFAVAAQMEPDILLIDEVLAVGDMGFVLKCFNKMDQLLNNTALIFVSHSMPQVSRICTELIVLGKGEAIYQSNEVSKGISIYYEKFPQLAGNVTGTGQAEIKSIYLTSGEKDSRNLTSLEIEHGDELTVHLNIKFNEELQSPSVGLMFYDKEQRNFGEVFNFKDEIVLDKVKGSYSFTAHFKEIQMGQGVFSITVGLTDFTGGTRKSIFRMQSVIYFRVTSAKHGWAPMQFTPEWKIENEQ
ncbi:MAG: ABC transporter ATP-binding protein [Bacteroidetes bacterium]|nr:ABC transporter ATP-binding protein [Bacteroidota bacterium]